MLTCPVCQHASGDLVADHCHATGQPRQHVCRSCNAGLGMFKDDPEALMRAAIYVLRHRSAVVRKFELVTEASAEVPQFRPRRRLRPRTVGQVMRQVFERVYSPQAADIVEARSRQ